MPWVKFGTDYAEALKGFGAWKQTGAPRNTIAWLLDTFTTTVCAAKVKAGKLSERTVRDYSRDAEEIKAGLGHIGIQQLTPRLVIGYIDERQPDAPSHVRNEIACLSAALSYAISIGLRETHPCREFKWPSTPRRMRLITHEEYLAVYAKAGATTKRAMTLCVRTLASPGDALELGPRNIVRRDGTRYLRFQRGKTKRWVEVEVVGELAQVVDEALAEKVVCETFLHRRDTEALTVNGIGAMFRRYCIAAGVTTQGEDGKQHVDFGLRDLRAKGATDMYLAGVDIRLISALLGHASEAMTRVYIKSYLPERVRPNEVPIVAAVRDPTP